MERKYYLRGLGLGIAVTAIFMSVVGSRGKTMTDQEIMARARELGMVENMVLADMGDEESLEQNQMEENPDPEDLLPEDDTEEMKETEPEEVTDTEDDTDADSMPSGESDAEVENDDETEAEPDSMIEDESDYSGTGESAEAEEEQSAEEARNMITSAAVKTITINGGDGSHTVARKLEEAGVVTSADAFDEFLCQNGYDKKLRTGTFSIPADASDEQIARIVTGVE